MNFNLSLPIIWVLTKYLHQPILRGQDIDDIKQWQKHLFWSKLSDIDKIMRHCLCLFWRYGDIGLDDDLMPNRR